ncbi:hypothetical protein LPJ70_001822 [Coemansia sp. RSA 2708]|nr:hypothetical protein LPJ70_001822 [Coemansia sp. RSA 2708]
MAARIDLGEHLPTEPASRRITGDTQFMFQFYKPCFQFYAPHALTSQRMGASSLRASLVAALRSCPLLLGRFVVHGDQSISLDYDPERPNAPTLEFHDAALSFAELRQRGFAYSLASEHQMDLAIPDGSISRGFDLPLLLVKVSYLRGGGVAVFSMSNHVAFDGNAVFSFLAHWAACNRALAEPQASVALPDALQTYATSLVRHTGNEPAAGPVEISVDATRTPDEIATAITRVVARSSMRACVFSITTASLARLKQQVSDSGVLAAGEWVSTNNVLAAFIAQHVARANMDAQTYDAGAWTVFQSLDMRRPLGLAPRGLGSPIMLAECQASYAEITDAAGLPALARRVRGSVDKYDAAYLQDAVDWMHAAYRRLAQSDVAEPWRHFWFTALNTNRRCVGVSCMNRIPIYDADFGAGRPQMARSFNPRPNYVIVFPGPPAATASAEYDTLHLYVTLEQPAMDALRADPGWSELCTLVSEF